MPYFLMYLRYRVRVQRPRSKEGKNGEEVTGKKILTLKSQKGDQLLISLYYTILE